MIHPHPLTRLALALALASGLGCATTSPEAIADAERRARSHYQMAMTHLREGRTGIAISELNAAREIQPDDAWIELALAEAYRLKALDAESEQHLRRALELRPDFHSAEL